MKRQGVVVLQIDMCELLRKQECEGAVREHLIREMPPRRHRCCLDFPPVNFADCEEYRNDRDGEHHHKNAFLPVVAKPFSDVVKIYVS